MSGKTLETLLQDIAEGAATPEQLTRARALLASDARFPDELRDALDEEPELGAGALLGLLGVDDGLGAELAQAVTASAAWDVADAVVAAIFPAHQELPVADAVRAEAGEVHVTAEVLETLERTMGPVGLAMAVRAEAGQVDVVEQVLAEVDQTWLSALLDHELRGDALLQANARLRAHPSAGLVMTDFAAMGRRLRAELKADAGEVSGTWQAVAPQLGLDDIEQVQGWDGQAFADAVRAQAGTVDLADAVMANIRGRAVQSLPRVPQPANDNRWQITSLAVAAVALFAVMVGLPGGDGAFTPPHPVALQFASGDEIVVNELSVADNATATVYRGEGENAPVIILVNEEIVL